MKWKGKYCQINEMTEQELVEFAIVENFNFEMIQRYNVNSALLGKALDKMKQTESLIAAAPEMLKVLQDVLHTGVAFNQDRIIEIIKQATK